MASVEQLELFDQLEYVESFDMEFKSAKGGLPGSLWETYSAFANTDGGTIFLGIAETKNKTFKIDGVENPEKLLVDFWNLINNRSKVSRNLLNQSHVEVRLEQGRKIIKIWVPRADRKDKPVYVGQDPFSGTYRRNHEGDYKCREDEVRRMFADQTDESADGRFLPGFTWRICMQSLSNSSETEWLPHNPIIPG